MPSLPSQSNPPSAELTRNGDSEEQGNDVQRAEGDAPDPRTDGEDLVRARVEIAVERCIWLPPHVRDVIVATRSHPRPNCSPGRCHPDKRKAAGSSGFVRLRG